MIIHVIEIGTDSQRLVLPPALRPVGTGSDNELRVIGYYGETEEILVGCGPTHPDVQVFLKRRDKDEEFKVCYRKKYTSFSFPHTKTENLSRISSFAT